MRSSKHNGRAAGGMGAGSRTKGRESYRNRGGQRRGERAYTLVEVVVASLILAITSAAFYTGLSSGFTVTQFSREEVRATQIMMQQIEAVRLCTWSQLTNYSFQQVYDPLATNQATAGVVYGGQVTITNAASIPSSAAYAADMCLVTVSLSWTNWNADRPVPHFRQMETQVARYGLQTYIWGAIP